MKKITLFIILSLLFIGNLNYNSEASLVSSGGYRQEQNKIYKTEAKQIKKLFEVHSILANKHDIQGLKPLYYDKYINSDGFEKEPYFKTVEQTWEGCKDLTYNTKILSLNINGNHAEVNVEETAIGTVFENIDSMAVAGEIHAKSYSIYQLIKINGKWLISGETMISDESYLLYGDARFMNIDLQAPNQVSSGEIYTVTVKIDADENTVVVGSIEHDPVAFPTKTPQGPLRTIPKTNVLERFIKANTDNTNEYAVTSLAISKSKKNKFNMPNVYMAGLACIMKRVNVVPKNKLIEYEENK